MQTQTGSALPRFFVRVGTWISTLRRLRGLNEPVTRLFEYAPSPAWKTPGSRTTDAFDPRSIAVLLIGGCKMEQERFYREYVRRADAIDDECVRQLRREGLLELETGWER